MADTKKILIIDDSTHVCLFIAQSLMAVGYQASMTSTGNDGIRRAFLEVPHCLIVDVILPDINGFEVCRRLRAKDPQHYHRIILISHKNTPLDHNWGLRQGADYYLPKPFTQEALVQVVAYVLSPAFRPPVNVLQLISACLPEPPVRSSPLDVASLIPVRNEEPELLTTDNPFSSVVVITDKQARRVYNAIDNRRSVRELCNATGLSSKEVYEALQFLLGKKRIRLYRPDGTQVDTAFLLDNQ